MARRVETVEEIKKIFQELQQSADDSTLPVRGMIQFVLLGKIPTAKLYVNKDSSAVAVLHEFSEYSQVDGDTAAVYARDVDSFRPFLKLLSEERLWTRRGRRCVMFVYIPDELLESAKSILIELPCVDLGSMRLQYAGKPDDDGSTTILPTGFRLLAGTPKDAQTIAATWNFEVPDKIKMFEWMFDRFPSVVMKDVNDRLVAWVLTYSCGASGPLYVLPEFRRLHFGRIVIKEVNRLHAQLPCPRYGGVSPQNSASIAFSTSNRAKPTACNASWLVFGFQNSESYSSKI